MLEEFPTLYLRAVSARSRFKTTVEGLAVVGIRFNQLRAEYLDRSAGRSRWRESLNDHAAVVVVVEEPVPYSGEIVEATATLLLDDNQRNIYSIVFDAAERTMVGEVLEHFQGNTVKTAAALGITRNRLRRRMRALRMKMSVEIKMDHDVGRDAN